MARINRDTTVRHQPNLGEEIEELRFAKGDAVTVLKEWKQHYLCKNADGLLFNLPKEVVDTD